MDKSITTYQTWAKRAGTSLPGILAAAPLPLLVQMVIDELTINKESFTAFDVTMILRAMFPVHTRWLPHYDEAGALGVQPIVHKRMADQMQALSYKKTLEALSSLDRAFVYSFDGGAAPVLAPKKVAPAPSIPALPAHVWVITNG
jgi:hypothetical protein